MTDRARAAQEAYDRGDFARARRAAGAILAGDPSAEERQVASAILARIRPDRVAMVVGVLVAILLVVIFVAYARAESR
jgi:hypothetical protein